MIVNLGDDEMSFTNQSAELRNACRNLRAGDEVMLDFRTLSNGDKPFIAILSKVDSRATDFTCINGEKFTRMMPLIHWPSRGNSDALHHVEGSERSHSDASWVVGIISKAPYKMEKNPIRNALYHQRMHKLAAYEKENKPYVDYTSYSHSKGLYRIHGIGPYAEEILSHDPLLDLPYGINAERMVSLWQKAGYPGLHGGYAWKTQSTVLNYPHDLYDNGAIDISEIVEMIIHRRQFKRWLLANISRIARTRKEVENQNKEFAKMDYQSYSKDLDNYFAEKPVKDDFENDTHERHMEDMFDWE